MDGWNESIYIYPVLYSTVLYWYGFNQVFKRMKQPTPGRPVYSTLVSSNLKTGHKAGHGDAVAAAQAGGVCPATAL